jgi:hypothetical protein
MSRTPITRLTGEAAGYRGMGTGTKWDLCVHCFMIERVKYTFTISKVELHCRCDLVAFATQPHTLY